MSEEENKVKDENKVKEEGVKKDDTKIVFLQMVDGTATDHASLQQMLLGVSKDTSYRFIVSPTANQLKSISIEVLKKLITEIEKDVKAS